jgi:hypothetical protein
VVAQRARSRLRLLRRLRQGAGVLELDDEPAPPLTLPRLGEQLLSRATRACASCSPSVSSSLA